MKKNIETKKITLKEENIINNNSKKRKKKTFKQVVIILFNLSDKKGICYFILIWGLLYLLVYFNKVDLADWIMMGIALLTAWVALLTLSIAIKSDKSQAETFKLINEIKKINKLNFNQNSVRSIWNELAKYDEKINNNKKGINNEIEIRLNKLNSINNIIKLYNEIYNYDDKNLYYIFCNECKNKYSNWDYQSNLIKLKDNYFSKQITNNTFNNILEASDIFLTTEYNFEDRILKTDLCISCTIKHYADHII